MFTNRAKKVLYYLGTVLTVLLVIWFIKYTVENSSAIKSIPLKLESFFFIFLISLISCLTTVLAGIGWKILYNAIGGGLNTTAAVAINSSAQFAKYFPGNVAHHIGRVVLSKKYGLNVPQVMFSMLLETLWVVGVCSLFTVFVLKTIGQKYFANLAQIPDYSLFLFMIFAIFLSPYLLKLMFKKLQHFGRRGNDQHDQTIFMPSFYSIWKSSVLYALNYLFFGVMIMLLAYQFFGSTAGDWLVVTGIFAVAWVVGFISPGAPAGLGVRELILVNAFTPIYGAEIAVGISALLRVVTVLGDGLAFLMGLALLKLCFKEKS